MELKPYVTERTIYGKGRNLYLVCWSRCANFGYSLMMGDTEQEVYNSHLYSKNKEVSFIITKINRSDLPVIFRGVYDEN